MKKIVFSDSELSSMKSLYVNKHYSLKRLAPLYGCSYATIRKNLNDMGVNTRENTKRKSLSQEDLNLMKKLYLESHYTFEQLANIFNCHPKTCYYYLKGIGVSISRKGSPAVINEKQFEQIKKLYLEELLSTTRIAKIFNCSISSVRNYLIRNGIPRRSREEGKFIARQAKAKI